jgi:hypothetical protein
MRSAICFTLRTMSVTSSRTPASDENSCSTPSMRIEVTAAPCSEDRSTRRKRVAERQTETALKRLGDERRLAARITRSALLEGVGLLHFLPVL